MIGFIFISWSAYTKDGDLMACPRGGGSGGSMAGGGNLTKVDFQSSYSDETTTKIDTLIAKSRSKVDKSMWQNEKNQYIDTKWNMRQVSIISREGNGLDKDTVSFLRKTNNLSIKRVRERANSGQLREKLPDSENLAKRITYSER